MNSRLLFQGNRIRHAGILPWMLTEDNTPIFLLGYESTWSGVGKWSEFGGKPERDDPDLYYSAAREAYEESMGMLGSIEYIFDNINKREAFVSKKKAAIIPYKVDDHIINIYKDLPILFERMYNYVTPCMRRNKTGNMAVNSCPGGRFEKSKIKWFTPLEIIETSEHILPLFRNFFMAVWDTGYFL